ncbi:hypothetical protein GCM10022222_57060 [Amycolatopsis ultiminotia]|uniref:Uncharacterized protein n=1 Tax=Amycolatopsis ultiminotia TaxID=543629 RepID=A0ABP6XEE4_9PSEU
MTAMNEPSPSALYAPGTATLYDRYMDRLPDYPATPGGITTPVVEQANAAAATAINAVNELLAEHYDVLTQDVDQLAERRYREAVALAVRAGEPTGGIVHPQAALREELARTLAQADDLIGAARKAASNVKTVVRAEARECGRKALTAATATRKAYLDKVNSYRTAETECARAYDAVGKWLVLGAWDTPVVSLGNLTTTPFGDAIRHRSHVDTPEDAVLRLLARLESYGVTEERTED